MSALLDALIAQRKQAALDYATYLAKVVGLTKQAKNGPGGATYPKTLNTPARRAIYDNFGRIEEFALFVDQIIRSASQDDWRSNPFKVKKIRGAIKTGVEMYLKQGASAATTLRESYGGKSLEPEEALADEILELVKQQHEY
jgi:type I restriction enzyme R subunit